MKRSTQETLREARTHFELMSQHAQGDLTDQLVIDAICMRLSAGIEALGRLESTRRDRLFGDAWPIMWGMRNRIAHGYLLLDADIVRRTVEHDIPSENRTATDRGGSGKSVGGLSMPAAGLLDTMR